MDTASLTRGTIAAEPEKDLPNDSTVSLTSLDFAQTPPVNEFTAVDQAYQASPSQASHNPLARSVVRTVIAGANDALNLLFDVGSTRAPIELASDTDILSQYPSRMSSRQNNAINLQEQASDDRIMDESSQHAPKPRGSPVRIWQSCHFVRVGWLTAREALQYVDL